MRLVCTSDTHGCEPALPPGDVLIHAGDLTQHGTAGELIAACAWLGRQQYPHKLVIGGNHDRILTSAYGRQIVRSSGLVYLEDSGCVLAGISFWGSPFHPTHPGTWAFDCERDELQAHWDKIPEGTVVLVTHGPPAGIMDELISRERVGCVALRAAVRRVRPRAHVFGHVHEAGGVLELDGTRYVNATFVARDAMGPRAGNPPTVMDL